MRWWHSLTIFTKALEVELDRPSHGLLDSASSSTRGDTTKKVRRIRGVAALRFLDDDEESHGFNPACLKIRFSVAGAKSALGFPRNGHETWLSVVPELSVTPSFLRRTRVETGTRLSVAPIDRIDRRS